MIQQIRPWLGVGLALMMGLVHGPAHAQTAPQTRQQAFDQAFEQAWARYQLPGLAVGIVHEGKVIYARTQGELAIGLGQPIDRASVFKIASNSKAMTAALLARLIDQGKLQWDDPVIKYLPDFRMHDPWVTQNMQVRDLLIHNSGLGAGAGDLMHWPEPNLFTRADVIHGLRYLKPVYSFRSRYAYDNTLYIVAGEVAAKAGGAPFDVLMRREVFQPLGLTRCQAGTWQRDAVGNIAQPHGRRKQRMQVINADSSTIPDAPMMAAGGIRCSLDDMLRWASMWLQPDTHGLVNGKPWLSQTQRDAAWSAQTIMPLTQRMRDWDNAHYSAYGYGWRLSDVDGTAKVAHTGTLGGMYSALTLLPGKHAGIVVLINAEADDARTTLTQALVKQFTAPHSTNISVTHYADLLAQEQQRKQTHRPIPDTSHRKPASARQMRSLLGQYRDPWFGEVDICPRDRHVVFSSRKSPSLTGVVMRAGKRLLVQWHEREGEVEPWLDFTAATDAAPARLQMAKIDPDADFSSDFEDLAFVRTDPCPPAARTGPPQQPTP